MMRGQRKRNMRRGTHHITWPTTWSKRDLPIPHHCRAQPLPQEHGAIAGGVAKGQLERQLGEDDEAQAGQHEEHLRHGEGSLRPQ